MPTIAAQEQYKINGQKIFSIKIENTVGADKNDHSMSGPRKQCLEQFPMPKIQSSSGTEISKGGQQDGFL